MPNVLTSWKEIGQYLGKGVRTVQRWELEAGLPVRRAAGSSGQAVLAIPEELDAWTRSRTKGPGGPVIETIRRELTELRQETAELRKRLELVENDTPETDSAIDLPNSWDDVPMLASLLKLRSSSSERHVRRTHALHTIRAVRNDIDYIRNFWSDTERIRAQTIRTHLSYFVTVCAIGACDLGYGTIEGAERAIEQAETSARGIRRNLDEPGYVPEAELGELRGLLNQLEERIQQARKRSRSMSSKSVSRPG